MDRPDRNGDFNAPLQLQGRGGPPNPAAAAIDLSTGRPWLHVTGTGNLVFPAPPFEQRDRSQPDCYVRANLRYIAPVNEEANIPSSSFQPAGQ